MNENQEDKMQDASNFYLSIPEKDIIMLKQDTK